MEDPLALIPAHAFKHHQRDKFEAKLTEAERCAVLALVRSSVDRRIVAVAFGIDRRTVGHITNSQSQRYRATRKELDRLGLAEFRSTYITEEIAMRVAEAAGTDEAKMTDTELKESPPIEKGPSRNAKSKEGINVVKPEQCSYSHRLEIKYFAGMAGISETGWHYRDMDSKTDSDIWLHNGEESLLTSSNCLKAAEQNLMDD